MVIISKTKLSQFGKKHSDAMPSLNVWYNTLSNEDYQNLSQLKSDFKSIDYVGNDRYVFNIKGNNYRLVTMIFFDIRTVFIRYIGTHAEYSKIDCSVI